MYIIVLLHFNLKIYVNDNKFEKKHSGRSGLAIIIMTRIIIFLLHCIVGSE